MRESCRSSRNIDFATLPGNYSETEADTGYTWIDGKKIYKKTVNFGALPNNTEKSIEHGISGINEYILFQGIATDGSYTIVIPSASKTSSNSVEVYLTKARIFIVTGSNRSGFNAFITLYYTKSN